jgi:hypothetical protein
VSSIILSLPPVKGTGARMAYDFETGQIAIS